MLVPGMRISWIRWKSGEKDGSCDVARNVEFSIREVAYSFLEAGDMQRDIAAGRELLGQSSELKHDGT